MFFFGFLLGILVFVLFLFYVILGFLFGFFSFFWVGVGGLVFSFWFSVWWMFFLDCGFILGVVLGWVVVLEGWG